MRQKNIEAVYCKIGVVTPREGAVSVFMKNGKTLFGYLPTQMKENLDVNLWDFGLPNRSLTNGDDILAISVWDRAHTRKFSDAAPDGIITGKSGGTTRSARPSIY